MAVYQGARRVPTVMPRDGGSVLQRRSAVPMRRAAIRVSDRTGEIPVVVGRGAVVMPRRRPTSRARARRRASPVFVSLALIVTAFVLGLMYLTQSIRVAATDFEIDRLLGERQRLEQQIQSLEGSIARWGAEPAVVERAGQAGLDRLGGAIRLPAR
ncbi:MAG: hypothetical protein H0W07_04870 [Chloroflexi bacterium]|nr:hypothetical protein [Chloroflexota bacterium]